MLSAVVFLASVLNLIIQSKWRIVTKKIQRGQTGLEFVLPCQHEMLQYLIICNVLLTMDVKFRWKQLDQLLFAANY
ncbi:hypothetical protein SCA6_001474 [Theobroma cacao]